MTITRRVLIKGSLGGAAAALVGAYAAENASAFPNRGLAALSTTSTTTATTSTTTAAAATTARFLGDPGTGRLYYGAACAASYGLSTLESQLGHYLGVHRSYFVPASIKELYKQVADDHTHGRVPSVSIKVPATWSAMASGSQDAWLGTLLTTLAATKKPVFLTLHHEPEEEAGPTGMKSTDWRAMQNHAADLAGQIATNVTIVPILMQYTFDPMSGRKPADWVPTRTKVFSTDCFNAWSATDGLHWRSLGDKMACTLPYAAGRPIVLGEYATREDPKHPGLAATWMSEAFGWARANNVVSMAFFNSWQHTRFGTWELFGERLDRMKLLIKRPETSWL